MGNLRKKSEVKKINLPCFTATKKINFLIHVFFCLAVYGGNLARDKTNPRLIASHHGRYGSRHDNG